MSKADSIRRKLTAALAPQTLMVEDESSRHAGHSGARPEGETHFRIRIVARAFDGQSRLERHRRVHDILAAELGGHIHALALSALTPEEEAAAEARSRSGRG